MRREQRERTTTAGWVKTVEMLGLVGETANTILSIVRNARDSLGPQAYLITLVVDVVGSIIFSYAARKLCTITERSYQETPGEKWMAGRCGSRTHPGLFTAPYWV